MLTMSNACVIVFLRWQVLEQKDWKLSLEIKSKEYISVFPLIFQLPLDVLCSYKALINSTCNSGLHRIFCQLSEYLYFYKMKTCKISCRKVKISISPRGGNFQFSARGVRYTYLKNFTSPTCNMPLRFGLEKCLDYLTEVRLILRYIGLRLP